MKPHPRIRKAIKWGCAAVTVLLMVVWIGSRFVFVGWETESSIIGLGISQGQFFVWRDPGTATNDPRPGLTVYAAWQVGKVFFEFNPFHWGYTFEETNVLRVGVPIWPAVVVMSLPTALAWRKDALVSRLARRNHCPNCNYDRSGLPSGSVCPECGSCSSLGQL